MQILKKLFFFLSPQEKKNLVILFVMSILMALLETTGIAFIFPFIAVLSDPSIVETNAILNTLFHFSGRLGVQNKQEFLFFLGILVFLFLIASQVFKAFTIYFQSRFIQMRESSIGILLIEKYLSQPYSWFLSRHSAELGKTILSEVSQIIANGISPLIELISKAMLVIAIVVLLYIVDPKLTFIISLSLGLAYLFIFYILRKMLSQIGMKRLDNNELRFKAVNEVFSAIKEVKIGSLEKTYIKNFSKSSKVFAKSLTISQVLQQLPRFLLEAIAFGGMLLIIIYMMVKSGNLNNSLPTISLYAFAGYRILPALQQIYSSCARLVFVGPSVDKLYSDIRNLKSQKKTQPDELVSFYKIIKLKNVYYNYPKSSISTLKDINLNIPVNSMVGFIGPTGSGKTTVVDIILGLLQPQEGLLEVDGKIITDQNLASWQQLIGYVPQQIYLSDDTVAANIAFGVDSKDINQKMVENAAKVANLHEFILEELPKKYQTTIGERGVRLSGGQRQRIGIARALYFNPKVLILDEATSALDVETEQVVMDAINKLEKNKTIILIAHRLNTLQNCDIIYKLKKGYIVGQGTFHEMVNE